MSEGNTQYNDVARTDPQTLVRWITDQQRRAAPNAEGNLSILLGSISVACKFVSSAVRKVRFWEVLCTYSIHGATRLVTFMHAGGPGWATGTGR